MIHVCFCFQDKMGLYSKFVGTSMLSIFENITTPPHLQSVTVHILHDNTLTADNRDKFIYISEQFGQRVEFYNVEELCADKIAELIRLIPYIGKTRVTTGACYTLFIPQIIPPDIEKIIYLDGDVIVNLDINELWQIDLDDKPLGAVTELVNGMNSASSFPLCRNDFVKGEDYFNSGVLLMNLKTLRTEEDLIMHAIKFVGENPIYFKFFDQDILNYCFSSRILKLPIKFNRFVRSARYREKIERKIYHYLGCALGSGINLNQNDIFNRFWMEHFIKTPFFNAQAIGNLYEEFLKMRSDLKSLSLNLSAIMSGKLRAFFIDPAQVDSIKKAFSIRDDETIILAENEDSLQNLIDAMKISKGKCVFFIMTEFFLSKKFSFTILTKEGFVENRDFVRGWIYLDLPLNSFLFIKAM